MRIVPIEKLQELQRISKCIRNVCILAHVDHGKTTLADCLLAANGIVSGRMAGKLRYLDYLPDEQERGITMKSSAVALYFKHDEIDSVGQEILLNLIDSPGHVDFCAEVSTATRLCDGAFLVVDAVEGVCPQTHTLLRQAWKENVRPLLVINKLDRLITELKMTTLDAYQHLMHLLQEVNAVVGEFVISKVMEAHEKTGESLLPACDNDNSIKEQIAADDMVTEDMEAVESLWYFAPENDTVVFASALDGWAFRTNDFARIFAKKTGVSQVALRKTLWGDFYLDGKTKRIKRGAIESGKKPLFVQLILDNIWLLYDTILVKKDKEALQRMLTALNVQLAPRDFRHHDFRLLLHTVMSAWLPLSMALLSSATTKLPNPTELSEEKVEGLMCSFDQPFSALPAETQLLKRHFLSCSSDSDVPTIAYVSKMFAVDAKTLPHNRRSGLSPEEIQQLRIRALDRHVQFAESRSGGAIDSVNVKIHTFDADEPVTSSQSSDEDVFLAFARVYTGTLKRGQKLYVLPPTHDPCRASEAEFAQSVQQFEVQALYVMMGRELEAVYEVPAGNVVAIGGLEDLILKSGTVSSTLFCPAFSAVKSYAEPIVCVAIEPEDPTNMPQLRHGLKLLNQADPCVKTFIQETGEHVLVTAGEVHLERCLADLRQRFSRIAIKASAPIIPFLETIVLRPRLDMVNEAVSGQMSQESHDPSKTAIDICTANQQILFRIRARPLPRDVVELLDLHKSELKMMEKRLHVDQAHSKLAPDLRTKFMSLRAALEGAFAAAGREWNTFPPGCSVPSWRNMWAIGPSKALCNFLFNAVPSYERTNMWDQVLDEEQCRTLRDYDQSIIHGFRLRCGAGPLCAEPIRGVGFILEEWTSQQPVANSSVLDPRDAYGPLSGQIIATIKEGCKLAFEAQPQRLVMAMSSCVVQANAEVLGKVYSVLGRRAGKVVGEEMKEGTNLFQVTAMLPVVESFGFAEEIRKKTSGLAQPQLVFSHWETLDVDPFWVPTTEEELLHFGEKADSENVARKYMNAVRRRKGLPVNEKIVVHAEKQRTLTKSK